LRGKSYFNSIKIDLKKTMSWLFRSFGSVAGAISLRTGHIARVRRIQIDFLPSKLS